MQKPSPYKLSFQPVSLKNEHTGYISLQLTALASQGWLAAAGTERLLGFRARSHLETKSPLALGLGFRAQG